jgi:hypothetical protein
MHAVATAGGGKKAAAAPVHPEWSQLLIDAVNKPGVMSTAYSRFWRYSVGNQLLALWQCFFRKLDPGPINTFVGWKNLGRSVKKGEKAITLCLPVSVKRRRNDNLFDPSLVRVGDGAERQLTGPGGVVPDAKEPVTVTVFTYKPNWFLLSQTDGEDYRPTELPEWSEERALSVLNVTRAPFHHTDGNCQG